MSYRERFENDPWRGYATIDATEVEQLVSILRREIAGADGDLQSSREISRVAGFFAARMAARGASGGELLASVRALDLDERDRRWLTAACVDAFFNAGCAAVREQYRAELAEHTPIVLLGPSLPAAFLVGPISEEICRNVLGALVLTVVRTNARGAIVDVSGVFASAKPVIEVAVDLLETHEYIAGSCRICWVGLAPGLATASSLDLCECRDLAHAIALCRGLGCRVAGD